jgi:Protein kinase domain
MDISIGEVISSGTTASVWHATDELNRELAIKIMSNPQDLTLDAVKLHALTLSQIDHPNVVRIYGIENVQSPTRDSEEIVPVLVMEYVSGQLFADWLAARTASKSECLAVLESLLDGLNAFHSAGLAHCDLHPKNIYVNNGHVKIIDPMAHDPATSLTTASINDRCRKDIRDAQWLIQQTICEFTGNTLQQGEFAMLNSSTSIPMLKHALRSALGEDRDALGDHFKVDFYHVCREAMDKSSKVEWQEARKSAIRRLQPELDQWSSANPSVSNQIDE